jgi:hypothetical protein
VLSHTVFGRIELKVVLFRDPRAQSKQIGIGQSLARHELAMCGIFIPPMPARVID